MNEILNCSLQAKSYMEKILDAYGNINSVLFIALPLALFIWAFNKFISYHKENNYHHNDIRDFIDKEGHKPFKKASMPFIRSIDESLTEYVLNNMEDGPVVSSHEFIKDFQIKKFKYLKDFDMTILEETIDFQEAMLAIAMLNKDQGALEGYIRKDRDALLFVIFGSLATLIFGGAMVYFAKVNAIEKVSFLFLVFWIITAIATLLSALIYGYYCSKIDSIKTKK